MDYNSHGLKVEYTEGIVTLKMEIRSNSLHEMELKMLKQFTELCNAIFGEEEILSTKKSGE